jgi:hypothetical protein
MTIEEIIQILENKLVFLNTQKCIFTSQGDLSSTERVNGEILITELTLTKLRNID